ncbi:cysteine hydrolase family protein [Bombilactobacillus thymidiniphilus]|uniref:Cysteine hydrolase n=1 Tax=Bombilactobacillus thymidiniphilus TaxID=2923363 RepID=A0ABY4PDZ5_9LACO|nr:isochorismatase family cysteine hydrolase [Bombilactobacillus thymidiniphilus]UQS84003.1 cysteine hydrolase [Bombilactobacillus thymidiniphilus]
MLNEALLIIDYTNDFVAEGGSLTAGKPAQLIEDNIFNLAQEFLNNDQWIILPTDLHQLNDPYHPETKLFPPHNLADSWGRQFYGRLQDWYDDNKQNDHVYAYAKNRYSAFANTNLDNFLRERNINKLHLTGVCTDICVLHTAISAYNLNYNLVIHQNGVATFNPDGQNWALDHFKNSLGATITN